MIKIPELNESEARIPSVKLFHMNEKTTKDFDQIMKNTDNDLYSCNSNKRLSKSIKH